MGRETSGREGGVCPATKPAFTSDFQDGTECLADQSTEPPLHVGELLPDSPSELNGTDVSSKTPV